MEKIFADWTTQEIANANNDLNSSYFQTGEYKKYESYFKLKEAFEYIFNNEQKRPLSVLDVGCGSGWHAVYLKENNFQLLFNGTDISEYMCINALKNFPDGNFFISNIIEENFKNIYDIVMESAVIELMSDWEKAIKNMLISSNKWFIAHRLFFTEEETKEEQVTTYFNMPDIRIHVGLEEFINILKKEGFTMVKKDVWRNSSYKMGTFIAKRV